MLLNEQNSFQQGIYWLYLGQDCLNQTTVVVFICSKLDFAAEICSTISLYFIMQEKKDQWQQTWCCLWKTQHKKKKLQWRLVAKWLSEAALTVCMLKLYIVFVLFNLYNTLVKLYCWKCAIEVTSIAPHNLSWLYQLVKWHVPQLVKKRTLGGEADQPAQIKRCADFQTWCSGYTLFKLKNMFQKAGKFDPSAALVLFKKIWDVKTN